MDKRAEERIVESLGKKDSNRSKLNDPEERRYLCIDMHCHSHYSSDGIASIRSILKKASTLGIGVAITDHNTIVGSQEALELSQAEVVVIPAIEVTTIERKDFIIYFYSSEEMIDFYNKHISKHRTKRVVNRTDLGLEQLIEVARQYRVFIGAPHPFALAYKNLYKYLKRKNLVSLISLLDGIEGVNASLSKAANLKAIALATSFNKPIFGGSDAHSVALLGRALTCSRARNYKEFLDNLAMGDSFVVGRKNRIYSSLSRDTVSRSNL